MWILFELVADILFGLAESGPSDKRLAKRRAKGIIDAHARVVAGQAAGLRQFWESKPRWKVEAGRLSRRDRVLAVASVDERSRVPTGVEEQVIGASMSIVTVRTFDAVVEIALHPRDEQWFRDRLSGPESPATR